MAIASLAQPTPANWQICAPNTNEFESHATPGEHTNSIRTDSNKYIGLLWCELPGFQSWVAEWVANRLRRGDMYICICVLLFVSSVCKTACKAVKLSVPTLIYSPCPAANPGPSLFSARLHFVSRIACICIDAGAYECADDATRHGAHRPKSYLHLSRYHH